MSLVSVTLPDPRTLTQKGIKSSPYVVDLAHRDLIAKCAVPVGQSNDYCKGVQGRHHATPRQHEKENERIDRSGTDLSSESFAGRQLSLGAIERVFLVT